VKQYDVLIIGAGAAGLICAIECSRRGRSVLVLEKNNRAGKKILISGGGRCNFTNLYANPEAYISNNPHFCKSALSRYTQWDFVSMMDKHKLKWHEKTLGQLFCDTKSVAVLDMLLSESKGVDIITETVAQSIKYNGEYIVNTNNDVIKSKSLVIASGGPSIPKMGATDFGVQVASQFGLKSTPFKPGLVPLTFHKSDIDKYFIGLSGISMEAIVSSNNAKFREMVLITHRGISGPAILQISSYWSKGDSIQINLMPDINAVEYLLMNQQNRGKAELKTILSEHFSRRLSERLANTLTVKELANTPLGQIKQKDLKDLGGLLNNWTLYPSGTEGMRTAEVCLGGVDVNELSSKTMESIKQPSLYFVGETVDITGWLGGYNFQWAWSSGWAAGQVA
jgi:predicted Rossmann fold flavoprotein